MTLITWQQTSLSQAFVPSHLTFNSVFFRTVTYLDITLALPPTASLSMPLPWPQNFSLSYLTWSEMVSPPSWLKSWHMGYGSVTVTPSGVHPIILVPCDLVCTFEIIYSDSEDFHKLHIVVATTLLHKLSHAIQAYFWDSKSPICLVWAEKKEGESGWLLKAKVFYKMAGIFFKAEKYEGE